MWGKLLTGAMVAGCLAIAGCGGDSSSDPAPASATKKSKAYFVDNAVIGLRYKCGSDGSLKLTNEMGVLRCEAGSVVRFYVGDILLGKVKMSAGTSFVTPQTLATTDGVMDENVLINLARFLTSLDSDQNLDNGIQIDPASHVKTGLSLDFTQSIASFETAVEPVLTALSQEAPNGPYALIAQVDAENHLIFGLYLSHAGYYEGKVQFSADKSTKLAFLVSRVGAAYGVNRSADGLYAAAAFDELSSHFSEFGEGTDFKIDGDTGATMLVDVTLDNGKAVGEGAETYPKFTATRKVSFDPLLNFALIEAFNSMLPVAIDLKGNGEKFVIDNDALSGMVYGGWEGSTPSSENTDLETYYWFINYADVISAKDGVLKLVALSTNGYRLYVTANFNGEVPAITTSWSHLFEGDTGTTSDYTANYSDEPVVMSATEKLGAKSIMKADSGTSGRF